MFFYLFYNTYFLIKTTPEVNIANVAVTKITYSLFSPSPVFTVKITGASSISSSSSFLLSGVESISGVLLSL